MIPVKHGGGNWYADADLLAELESGGQIALRYVDDVNGAVDRVAGVTNEAGNVLGLMPHPEHAVDPLLGPVGGVPILEGLIQAARERLLVTSLGRDIDSQPSSASFSCGVRSSAPRSRSRSGALKVTGPRRAVLPRIGKADERLAARRLEQLHE